MVRPRGELEAELCGRRLIKSEAGVNRQMKLRADTRWRRWESIGDRNMARNAGLFWKRNEEAAF
jgi:hypothetical protein